MKIAILETGVPPPPLAETFGDYPSMFADLLGDSYSTETFDVQQGRLPDPSEHEAILITGSPAGVYEPLPWIEPLMSFIRGVGDKKMIGVCFGHQVMAEALGGKVIKSPKGSGPSRRPAAKHDRRRCLGLHALRRAGLG